VPLWFTTEFAGDRVSAGVAIFAIRETLREQTVETSQLQTFTASQGFDRFTLFLFKSSPNDSIIIINNH